MKPTILEVQAMLDKHFLQPQFCINYSTNRENSSFLLPISLVTRNTYGVAPSELIKVQRALADLNLRISIAPPLAGLRSNIQLYLWQL
jgi:hypothetical protein